MSRLKQAHKAVRPALKARALLSGPPGAGKTRSALIVAETLAEGGTILVIDTEKESALTYADDFAFDHLPWQPPYEPRVLAETVLDAGQQYTVVIVDSLSHFWRGDGGILDIAGGKYTGWADARPAQSDLVEALLRTEAHFIACARSKVAHEQVQENGRWVVKKLGMAIIQDDDLEYELNVALELDMDHSLVVSKSRTVAVPVGRSFKAGHAEDFAALYRDWLKGGEPLAQTKVVKALRERMDALPELPRMSAKQEFMAQFGRPDHLRESQVADAESFVAAWEMQAVATNDSSVAEKRNAKMWALVGEAWPNEADGDPDELRHHLISAVTGGRVESSKTLTDDEWTALFAALEATAQGALEVHLKADGSWSTRKPSTKKGAA